jgi:hypothetical protein
MNKDRYLISRNMNRKLKPGGIVVFNLPAGATCGQVCPSCYAMKAQKMYKSAREKRIWNLAQSKRPDFVARMVTELTSGHCRDNGIVRFHESGDVYSQEYLDKLAQIALQVQQKTFYMYTKRRQEFDFRVVEALENFILIDSLKFGPVNYGDAAQVEAWEAAGAFICPVRKGEKGVSCNNGCRICVDRTNKAALLERGLVFYKH